jgi:hypothetical protein
MAPKIRQLPIDVKIQALARYDEVGGPYTTPEWDPKTEPFSLRQISADVLRRAEYMRNVSLCFHASQPALPYPMSNVVEQFYFKLFCTAIGRKIRKLESEPEDKFVSRFLSQLGQRPRTKILL